MLYPTDNGLRRAVYWPFGVGLSDFYCAIGEWRLIPASRRRQFELCSSSGNPSLISWKVYPLSGFDERLHLSSCLEYLESGRTLSSARFSQDAEFHEHGTQEGKE